MSFDNRCDRGQNGIIEKDDVRSMLLFRGIFRNLKASRP